MDFAPNVTPRYVFRYTHQGQGHSITVRNPRGAPRADSGNVTKLGAFLNAIRTVLVNDFSIIDGVYYPQDETIGLPVDTASSGFIGGNILPVEVDSTAYKAFELRFQSKSNSGAKGSLSIFGAIIGNFGSGHLYDDYRIVGGESAAVNGGVIALNELSPAWVPITGGSVIWRNYANYSPNKYWVNQYRG